MNSINLDKIILKLQNNTTKLVKANKIFKETLAVRVIKFKDLI